MKTYIANITSRLGLILVLLILIFPSHLEAQRMGHRASRGGGQTMSRSTSRPAPSRTTTNRTPSKSINGGHTRTSSRNFSTNVPNRTTKPTTTNRPADGKSKIADTKRTDSGTRLNNTNNKRTSNIKNKSGNKIGSNNGGGNNVNINIDNSRRTNINNRNTRVNASSRHYTRPPYRYGGFHYYCHRPYFYHPYTPFYWGPVWHPWGFFVTTLATTAIIVSISNTSADTNKDEYYYEEGTYYLKTEDGFVAVQAPIGAEVPSIPKEAQQVEVNETTNNYYYGGAFYEKNADGYIVVPATAGTIVPGLPEGGEEVKIGDVTYVQFGETYYQPIQVDGKNMYEIVEVKED